MTHPARDDVPLPGAPFSFNETIRNHPGARDFVEQQWVYRQSARKVIDEYHRERESLRSEVERLREALSECEEYLDERADADSHYGSAGHIPNEEMTMLIKVRAALQQGSIS